MHIYSDDELDRMISRRLGGSRRPRVGTVPCASSSSSPPNARDQAHFRHFQKRLGAPPSFLSVNTQRNSTGSGRRGVAWDHEHFFLDDASPVPSSPLSPVLVVPAAAGSLKENDLVIIQVPEEMEIHGFVSPSLHGQRGRVVKIREDEEVEVELLPSIPSRDDRFKSDLSFFAPSGGLRKKQHMYLGKQNVSSNRITVPTFCLCVCK